LSQLPSRLMRSKAKLEVNSNRDRDGDGWPYVHNLALILRASPHLTAAGDKVPSLLDSMMGHSLQAACGGSAKCARLPQLLLHRPRTSDPSGAVASGEKPSHLIAIAECVAAQDACQLPYPRRRALDAFSGPLAGTRFRRTAIGDGNRVRQKDVLVCLCCGFTSLWSVILSDNGMILPGQQCHQQYCYCHTRSPLPLSGEPLPYLDAHR
jgi:hypothetical protein